jgi:type II secretory pathway component PulK
MTRGTHPNSLQNLTHQGRPLDYDEPKKTRRLSITETGWDSAQKLIRSMGMSVSEFVEKLGRGQLIVMSSEDIEAFQDAIDSAQLRQAIAEANGEFMTADEVLAGQGLSQAVLNE